MFDAIADTEQPNASRVPPLANAELVQLQIRVIALENLVIAMLSDAPARQLDLVRDKAAHILPRPGFTPHRLTIAAATEMNSLVERAIRFSIASSPAANVERHGLLATTQPDTSR